MSETVLQEVRQTTEPITPSDEVLDAEMHNAVHNEGTLTPEAAAILNALDNPQLRKWTIDASKVRGPAEGLHAMTDAERTALALRAHVKQNWP